jgi:hypothetical protein
LWLRQPRSVLLYVLGIAGILALPFMARNTYIDENAMLAGARAARAHTRAPSET